MDHQSLTNVLEIFRAFKNHNKGHSAANLVKTWCKNSPSEAEILRVSCYILEEIYKAKSVISSSNLTDEAKEGLLGHLSRLEKAFSLEGINNPTSNYISDYKGAISHFVILLSASGLNTERTVPDEASTLITEIEQMIDAFSDPAIDPLVRDTARRHLQILATMLRHIPIFGLEAALTSYFELMMKIRRVETGASKETKSKVNGFWTSMEKWAGRLSSIDKIWNAGARAIRSCPTSWCKLVSVITTTSGFSRMVMLPRRAG